MNKNDADPSAPNLRQRAEAQFAVGTVQPSGRLSSEEKESALHELQVHQIELELQNEELRRTQADLEAAWARYFDLYHLAPVAYIQLSAQGLSTAHPTVYGQQGAKVIAC